jgi:hypothetical protein
MIALLLAKEAGIDRAVRPVSWPGISNCGVESRNRTSESFWSEPRGDEFQWTFSLLSYRFLTWGGLPSA